MNEADNYLSLIIAIIAVIYSIGTVIKSIMSKDEIKYQHDEDSDYTNEDELELEEEQDYEDLILQKKKQKIEYERKQQELRKQVALKQVALKQEKLQKIKSEQQFYQPPLPTEQKEFSFHSELEDFKQHTSIDDRHLEINLRPGTELTSAAFRLAQSEGSVMVRPSKPTIQDLIKSLPQEKLLFLSYEVFHVPVSRRPTPFPWNG